MLQRILSAICKKEHYDIEGKRYYVREVIGEGFVHVHRIKIQTVFHSNRLFSGVSAQSNLSLKVAVTEFSL